MQIKEKLTNAYKAAKEEFQNSKAKTITAALVTAGSIATCAMGAVPTAHFIGGAAAALTTIYAFKYLAIDITQNKTAYSDFKGIKYISTACLSSLVFAAILIGTALNSDHKKPNKNYKKDAYIRALEEITEDKTTSTDIKELKWFPETGWFKNKKTLKCTVNVNGYTPLSNGDKYIHTSSKGDCGVIHEDVLQRGKKLYRLTQLSLDKKSTATPAPQ